MKKLLFAFLIFLPNMVWAGPFDNEKIFGSNIFDNPTDKDEELDYDDSSNETFNQDTATPVGDAVWVLVIGGVLYAVYTYNKTRKKK